MAGRLCFRDKGSSFIRFNAGVVAGGSLLMSVLMLFFAFIISFLCSFQKAYSEVSKSISTCPPEIEAAVGMNFSKNQKETSKGIQLTFPNRICIHVCCDGGDLLPCFLCLESEIKPRRQSEFIK
jgi:hypothetical protein